MNVLKSYLNAGNLWIFGLIIFCFLNRFVARVWYSWSLSQWTNDAENALGSESESQSSAFGRLTSLNNHYILVQGLLVLYETMAYLTVCCIWVFYGRRASEKIQRKFITLITFAKASFFDTFVSIPFFVVLPCFHFIMMWLLFSTEHHLEDSSLVSQETLFVYIVLLFRRDFVFDDDVL